MRPHIQYKWSAFLETCHCRIAARMRTPFLGGVLFSIVEFLPVTDATIQIRHFEGLAIATAFRRLASS